MRNRDIVVIGGSAGSGPALREILGSIPSDLPAAIFVAIHRSLIDGLDYVPCVLQQFGNWEAALARDGETFEIGRIYVAPADGFLSIEGYTLRVDRTMTRPSRNSIDALFRSAAINHGRHVIGVLVSGMLTDGTAGFWHIRKHGGITIAQDPTEAQCSSMPQSAMKEVPVDYCLRSSEIGIKLRALVRSPRLEAFIRKHRIIIVEDDWVIASDLQAQLNDLGYEVVGTALSGEEALRSAELVTAEVAIMDVRLAGVMRGTEVARHLRERFQIPSIFLTAYADLETYSAAQASEPYAFLAKPHHATELNFAIQLALQGRERILAAKDSSVSGMLRPDVAFVPSGAGNLMDDKERKAED